MKNAIIIDTSGTNTALLVRWQGKILVSISRRLKFGASKIIVWLEKTVIKHKLSLKKIDAVVICAGPGSFTGLRIGFSVVKALSMSLSAPIITVPAFLAMARQVYFMESRHSRIGKIKIAVIADARRNLIYAAAYAVRKNCLYQITKERLCLLADFVKAHPDWLYVTYDEHIRRQALSCNPRLQFHKANVYPAIYALLELALELYARKKFTPIEKLTPLYLHPKTCQINGFRK